MRTDSRAYGHVITEISRIDRLPNFLRYGAPLARTSRGAPFFHSHLNWRDKINIGIKGKYKKQLKITAKILVKSISNNFILVLVQ